MDASNKNTGGVLEMLFPVVGITCWARMETCDAADMSKGGIVAIINDLFMGA